MKAIAWLFFVIALFWCWMAADFFYYGAPILGSAYCLGALWTLHKAIANWRFERAASAAEAALARMSAAGEANNDIAFEAASEQVDAAIARMKQNL